ncbi:MAG: ATP-binding protein [Collinsella sp.]
MLIGRESVIEDFEEGLDNGAGAPGRLMLITGNRGCGKTVLLRELQRLANERGWAVVSDSASLGLCDRLADALRSNRPVVTSMEFGPSFGRMSVEAARAKGGTLRGAGATSASRSSVRVRGKHYRWRLTRRNPRLSR